VLSSRTSAYHHNRPPLHTMTRGYRIPAIRQVTVQNAIPVYRRCYATRQTGLYWALSSSDNQRSMSADATACSPGVTCA
jgi:hypothetical protein